MDQDGENGAFEIGSNLKYRLNVGCLSFLEGCFKYIDRPIFVSFYKLQYDISTSFSLKTVVIIRMLLQKLLHKWKQPATSPKLNL